MLIKKTYTCEYCGKTFDDIDECRQHEADELFRRVENKIVYLDHRGMPLSVLNCCPEDIFYFWVADEEAFDCVNKYFLDWHYDRPSRDTPYCEGYFYYDEESWHNIKELEDKIREIQKIFKDAEKIEG